MITEMKKICPLRNKCCLETDCMFYISDHNGHAKCSISMIAEAAAEYVGEMYSEDSAAAKLDKLIKEGLSVDAYVHD